MTTLTKPETRSRQSLAVLDLMAQAVEDIAADKPLEDVTTADIKGRGFADHDITKHGHGAFQRARQRLQRAGRGV